MYLWGLYEQGLYNYEWEWLNIINIHHTNYIFDILRSSKEHALLKVTLFIYDMQP